MEKLKKLSTTFAVFAFLGFASFTDIYSQNNAPGPGGGGCVGCVPAGHGWLCMSSGQGGEACTTDGANCTLIGPCVGGLCANQSVLSKEKVELQIDDSLIIEIGKTDPRMATVLISLRKLQQLSFSEGIVNSAPIEMTLDDVAWQLKKSAAARDYSARLKQRIGEAFDKGFLPTVYTFKIERNGADENSLLLKIENTESGSIAPSHSGLEVSLSVTKSELRNPDNTTNKLKAISWTIK